MVFVKAETIKKYEEIDPVFVITEYFLDKYPINIIKAKSEDDYVMRLSDIVEHALLIYRLTFNTTNRKNVEWIIEKYFRRNFLFDDKNRVRVPKEVTNNDLVKDTIARVEKHLENIKY